jgi:Amt family ammonium transporter
MVAFTPSCDYLIPVASIGLGLVSGVASALFVELKFKYGFDDSLDVVGVHLGSGLVGTLALGFIALPVDGEGGGLFYGGGVQQLIAQTVAVLITLALSGLVTAIIGLAIHKTIGFRVSHEAEVAGVDRSEHAESAYEFGSMGHSQFHPLRQHFGAVPSAHPADTPAGPATEGDVSPEAAEELQPAPASA